MKDKLLILLLIIFTMVILSPLFSQDDNETEIEDIYLENPELMMVEKQAYSGDRYTQLEGLEGIESFLNDLRPGDPDEDGPLKPIDPENIPPQLEDMLIHLGSQGSLIITKRGNTIVNDFPEVRRKACELLGWVRTEKS